METIALIVHAYILVLIYEILSEDKHYFLKWVVTLLIWVTKYIVESSPYTKNIAPLVLCTILVIYSMFTRSQNSNLTNMKYAIVAYGMDYAMSIVIGCVCGFMATLIHIESREIAY